ncbi:cell division protein ZapA [Pseudoteredinibacter isoporae]|uniref:cell division protein ZapA n=1 Tax=Pseudoteredinibacter isoporae TaxID=570281 RepID=UPI0014243DA5|nr:cell division protein ZapA [Pseudoteredinibacter isoporae]NHO85526.1 cell division protein ZapA [Pseudoteredinibacter isoporae]NIB26022.1 cell division protein ZapA [Pseudoteredinibacter isoporae]
MSAQGERTVSNTTPTEFVKILDKEYQVACTPEERDALMQAARNLDARMRDVRTNGNVIGLERIAVMVALNLSHELLSLQRRQSAAEAGLDDELLNRLAEKLDKALK